MVEIECLACGKTIKIPQIFNTDKYDGQVRCQECKSLLDVKLIKGKVEKYKVVEKQMTGDRPVNIIYKQVGDRKETESGQNIRRES